MNDLKIIDVEDVQTHTRDSGGQRVNYNLNVDSEASSLRNTVMPSTTSVSNISYYLAYHMLFTAFAKHSHRCLSTDNDSRHAL